MMHSNDGIYTALQGLTPPQEETLVHWLDTKDKHKAELNGNALLRMPNKGTAGGFFEQTVSADQPTYVSYLNGHHVLDFNGTSQYLRFTTPSRMAVDDFTIFVVFKHTSTARGLLVGDLLEPNDYPLNFEMLDSSNHQTRLWFNTNPDVRLNNGYVTNQWGTYGARRKQATDEFNLMDQYGIGSTVINSSPAAMTYDPNQRFLIGADGRFTIFLKGQLAEILIYPFALDTNEIADVNNYLNTKWEIGTPLIWYDMSDLTTITTSAGNPNLASKIANKGSSTGNDSIQVTESLQPATGVTTQNGLNVFDFAGGGDRIQLLDFADGPIVAPFTMFIVYKCTTQTANGVRVFDGGRSGSERTLLQHKNAGSNVLELSNGAVAITANLGIMTDFQIVSIISNSPNSDMYRNGIKVLDNVNPGTNPLDGITIGATYDGVASLVGSIAEIRIYPGLKSDTAREFIEAELSTKWSLI